LTATGPQVGSTVPNGAYVAASHTSLMQRAEELFPKSSQVSQSYRMAYATSHELMEQIDRRRSENEQCGRGYGAPQGPLGEIYSTHTTIYVKAFGAEPGQESSLTWRYVVGVQLSDDFNVSAQALAVGGEMTGAKGAPVSLVSYKFDDSTTFQPITTDELVPFGVGYPLMLRKSDDGLCETGQGKYPIQTRCFPFQWHAIAPVASNGWALTGEVGKFVPVSQQRIVALSVLTNGGFELQLHGAPDELVTIGAADVRRGGKVHYAHATIGSDGTANLRIPSPATLSAENYI